MVSIDVKALKPGIHEYEWNLGAEALEMDPTLFQNIDLYVRLDFHPSRIFVTIQADSLVQMTCDRTLNEFVQEVHGEYHILFSGPEFFEGKDEEDEDVRLLTSDMEELDLTDSVRDTILLSLPQRRIAPGAEDQEIQLQYGLPENGDAAIDPRWEALKGLYSGDEPSGMQESVPD